MTSKNSDNIQNETTYHAFSLSNPYGPDGPNLPLLLRRLADLMDNAIEQHDSIADVLIDGSDVNEFGAWWTATVYVKRSTGPR